MKKNEKWILSMKKADFQAIASQFGIDPVTARLIRNRDIVGEEQIKEYLHGTKKDLISPSLLKGAGEAVLLLKQKIEEQKKIRIIGDYDIDGVSATYILYKGLRFAGANVDYEIPDRMKDGYGLNRSLISLAIEEKVDTILTCDNGIAAREEIGYAKENGLTVIVTDHHEPLYTDENGSREYLLPQADVIVNPRQPGCNYPFKKLCGAAVAWKVICLLYELTGVSKEKAWEFLPFVCIATVGDVMDLVGENRIIVKEGLKDLADTQNKGLLALIRANGLHETAVSSYHIGFVIGPCINASGRLDTAKRSLKLLLAESDAEAMRLAEELKTLNDQRKDLTADAVAAANQMIESAENPDKVLVIYLPHCHESIAGIVAGKVRERYYRPTLIVTDGENCAKGSGRSIEAYSMFDELIKCDDLFIKYGGHPMAAGFSLEKEKIPALRERLNENVALTEDDLTEKVSIDVPMPIHYISEKLIGELDYLEPFGKGNEKPLFAEKGLRLLSARILGKNRNVLKMQVVNSYGTCMDALYFGDLEELLKALKKEYGDVAVSDLLTGRGRQHNFMMDFTYYPIVNEFQNRRTLQIIVKHYKTNKNAL